MPNITTLLFDIGDVLIDDQPKNKIGAEVIGLNFLLIQKNEDLREALNHLHIDNPDF